MKNRGLLILPQDPTPSSLSPQGERGFNRSSSELSSSEGVGCPKNGKKKKENEGKEEQAGELKASRPKEILLMKEIPLQ